MAANKVVLILGAGPRVGTAVAKKFASEGYKVAVASRSGGKPCGLPSPPDGCKYEAPSSKSPCRDPVNALIRFSATGQGLQHSV